MVTVIVVLSVLIVMTVIAVVMVRKKCMKSVKYGGQVVASRDTGQQQQQPYQPVTLQCFTGGHPDSQYNNLFHYHPNYLHSSPLLQMRGDLSLSSQTLDNEIKL